RGVMVGTAVERVAVLTGWGDGLGALPENAARAAAGRLVIPIPRPDLGGDRFRRATRECLLGIAAVDALLRDGGMSREAIRGTSTRGAGGSSGGRWSRRPRARSWCPARGPRGTTSRASPPRSRRWRASAPARRSRARR